MTFTVEQHERVLKAAGIKFDSDGDAYWESEDELHLVPEFMMIPNYEVFAAKYLLPVALEHIESMHPQMPRPKWLVTYAGETGFTGNPDKYTYGATFGEALFAFVLALLDAGVIPEVPE